MKRHSRNHIFDMRYDAPEKGNTNNVMSEKVQILANNIYKEFERLISFYGSDVVECLMPLIVTVLENLEELYRIKQSYEIELELLKDDNNSLANQYEKEKLLKKQMEERILHMEYSFDDEKKRLEEKIMTMEFDIRFFENKIRNCNDSIERLEEKVQVTQSEKQKLYEKYTDILKSHAEYLNRVKIDSYNETFNGHSVGHNKWRKSPIKFNNNEKNIKSLYPNNAPSKSGIEIENYTQNTNYSIHGFDSFECPSPNEEPISNILGNDQYISDFNYNGNDKDLISDLKYSNLHFSHTDSELLMDSKEINHDDQSLDMNLVDSEPEDIVYEGFGIEKEIEFLIRENQELVDTKNALNVVKDDLISRLDLMTSENELLREDISHYSNREADMKGKLSHFDKELKACKEELSKVKESKAEECEENNLLESKKTFSRTDMSILMEEKNYYKEKLLELQDALVYKENCRLKNQFPDLKDISKPTKSNNSSIWNLFGNIFKKDSFSETVEEKSKNLLSRFKYDSDRSQLYSWSVPRTLIESSLPKRVPIPIKIQAVFEPKDVVVCVTTGFEESPGFSSAQYLWCLVQSNMKNNKNYYLMQMCLTEKVPELTNKYSINLQFPTVPITMIEVPALIFAIKDFNSLIVEDLDISITKLNQESFEHSKTDDSPKISRLFQTKVQMKQKTKNNIGSKTLWFGCERNQVVVYILLDNNRVENRLATFTMESEIESIRYHLGRVFVIQKNGSLGVFDLNKEMNQWDFNQCLLINISEGLPISDLCCDINRRHLWIGSSTNCFILNMSFLKITKSLQIIEESYVTDHCTSVESMNILEKFSLMLVSVSRIGLVLGYDLKSFKFMISLDMKPSVFDLIEPIHGVEKSTLSLFHLTVDNERIWMTTDCGMILVVTLDTIYNHLNPQSYTKGDHKSSLTAEKIYISSHAFAQCIKIISILAHSCSSTRLENPTKLNTFKEISENSKIDYASKNEESNTNESIKKYFLMTAMGSSYVNLNHSPSDIVNSYNHTIIWKI